MKWNSGLSRAEKRARLEQWHDWFAWLPTRINGCTYWLETVERKGTQRLIANGEGMPERAWSWQYRTKSVENENKA